MSEEWLITLLWATWLSLATTPLGFMLGAECSPCCDKCGGGLPYSDPGSEGKWVPVNGPVLQWEFIENPGDDSGNTWYFYGTTGTVLERQAWDNPCNWYSKSSLSPIVGISPEARASRLPDANSVIHVFSSLSTGVPRTVKHAYFWGGQLLPGSAITTTSPAPMSNYGCIFAKLSQNRGAVTGGAEFHGEASNRGVVLGGARFFGSSQNRGDLTYTVGDVSGGASFYESSRNFGRVRDGDAFFYGSSGNSYDLGFGIGVIQQNATFFNFAFNDRLVIGDAIFNENSYGASGSQVGRAFANGRSSVSGFVDTYVQANDESVVFAYLNWLGLDNQQSVFNNASQFRGFANRSIVTFNDSSSASGNFSTSVAVFNNNSQYVTGDFGGGSTATFNDAACSRRGFFSGGQIRYGVNLGNYVCNGTAPKYADIGAGGCGCG